MLGCGLWAPLLNILVLYVIINESQLNFVSSILLWIGGLWVPHLHILFVIVSNIEYFIVICITGVYWLYCLITTYTYVLFNKHPFESIPVVF